MKKLARHVIRQLQALGFAPPICDFYEVPADGQPFRHHCNRSGNPHDITLAFPWLLLPDCRHHAAIGVARCPECGILFLTSPVADRPIVRLPQIERDPDGWPVSRGT